jgi:hypothetical protein
VIQQLSRKVLIAEPTRLLLSYRRPWLIFVGAGSSLPSTPYLLFPFNRRIHLFLAGLRN